MIKITREKKLILNMKIVAINSYNHASTGKVMRGILALAKDKGYEVFAAYPRSKSMQPFREDNDILIGNRIERNIHIFLGYITGLHGFFSICSTVVFLKKLLKISPDIIHIHSLHLDYLNIPLLIWFINRHQIRCIMTMHDCWDITGQCTHFSYEGCEKWMSGCHHCPKTHVYPDSLVDSSSINYRIKKKLFCSIEDLTIVTPSHWLANIVKKSFLGRKKIHVVNNGIPLPNRKVLSVKETVNDQREKLVLGVAYTWTYKKGIDIISQISQSLPDNYKMVIIGNISDDISNKYDLSKVRCVDRVHDRNTLLQYFSEAAVFINPTREEVLGLVNIEALSCGTPVVTFDTGGSPECIDDTCGRVVSCGDVHGMLEAILELSNIKSIEDNCVRRARLFDECDTYKQYLNIYTKG